MLLLTGSIKKGRPAGRLNQYQLTLNTFTRVAHFKA